MKTHALWVMAWAPIAVVENVIGLSFIEQAALLVPISLYGRFVEWITNREEGVL